MSNRFWSRERYSPDKALVDVNAVVNIGATGAPTLKVWTPASGGGGAYTTALTGGARGVKSIVRNGTGDYTVTLQDSYQRLVNYNLVFQGPSLTPPVAPIATVVTTGTNVGTSTGGTIRFICQSSAGAAADPASGEVLLMSFALQNSTAA